MSSEMLRRAATELRATVHGAAPGMVSDPDFKLAVADWLDVANEWSASDEPEYEAALAVAHAYMGWTE